MLGPRSQLQLPQKNLRVDSNEQNTELHLGREAICPRYFKYIYNIDSFTAFPCLGSIRPRPAILGTTITFDCQFSGIKDRKPQIRLNAGHLPPSLFMHFILAARRDVPVSTAEIFGAPSAQNRWEGRPPNPRQSSLVWDLSEGHCDPAYTRMAEWEQGICVCCWSYALDFPCRWIIVC